MKALSRREYIDLGKRIAWCRKVKETWRGRQKSVTKDDAVEKGEMSPSYGALRLWPAALVGFGAMGTVLVVTGAIVPMLGAATSARSLAIFLISGVLGALSAKRPNALRRGLRTHADVAEYVQEQEGWVR